MSISTLFAIMLSLLLTQRIVQPVAAMTRTAQRMANGNYGERVTIPTTTEIAQLGESLNHLSGNLYTTIRSLNQEKIKMELVLSGIGEGIMAINQIGKMVHCNDAAVKLLELREEDAQCDVYELTERSPLIGMLIQVLETGETLDGGWKKRRRSVGVRHRFADSHGRRSGRRGRTGARCQRGPSGWSSCAATMWPTYHTNCALR